MTENQKGAVLASQHCDRQQDQMTQGREVHAELSVLKNTKNICCPSFASPARMFGAAFFASGRGEAGQETNFQGRLWVGGVGGVRGSAMVKTS